MEKDSISYNELPEAMTYLIEKIDSLEKLFLEQFLNTQDNRIISEGEKLLSVKECANFLNLAPATIYSKVSREEIPYMKRGKKLYFSESELLQYLKEGRSYSEDEITKEVDSYLSNKKSL